MRAGCPREGAWGFDSPLFLHNISIVDVFKKAATPHTVCKFWGCWENGPADRRAARRTGRRVLRQEDLDRFREYLRKDP